MFKVGDRVRIRGFDDPKHYMTITAIIDKNTMRTKCDCGNPEETKDIYELRLIKEDTMREFQEGDRVRMKEYCSSAEKGEIYTLRRASNGVLWADDRCNCPSKWELVKKGESNMRERIEALTGWDKEADDLLEEIVGDNKGRPEICIPCNNGNDKGIIIRKDNYDLMEKDSPYFPFKSQCSKLRAFKDALLWLLDKSGLEKKEKEKSKIREEIAQLKAQNTEITEKITQLEKKVLKEAV